MCENRVLALPANILPVWRAGLTWPHDTVPCVLITCTRHYQPTILISDGLPPVLARVVNRDKQGLFVKLSK